MKIIVYGPGCARCRELENRVKAALESLSLDCVVEKVTGVEKMVEAGVMMTPALEIDGRLVLAGRLPAQAELAKIIAGQAGIPNREQMP